MDTQFKSIVNKKDARKLNEFIKGEIVDVTITSPPYFNLKDYGYTEQIGYGQKYDDYLEDLKIVFKNVYDCTKDNGTLWVVIDSFRKDGEVTPLPFDFSNKIKEVGWKLQDIIVWQKDRTVPWAHKGQMRNIFEYILLFSKGSKYNFFIDKIRDSELLKKWWVKYPERYNPKGKTPDGIWSYDIPTQGSWGNDYIKHFCPLPESMIEQILKLTTKEGDIVLDPFAGSGAVLSKADSMLRNYIGFELNEEYINMFKAYLRKTRLKKRKEYIEKTKTSISQGTFKKLILNLRALKFSRVLYANLNKKYQEQILKIYVEHTTIKSQEKNKLLVVDYYIYVNSKENLEKLSAEIDKIIFRAPLSKYGIDARINYLTTAGMFLNKINNTGILYSYSKKITHKYTSAFKKNHLDNLTDAEIIISKIKVNLNENDYN